MSSASSRAVSATVDEDLAEAIGRAHDSVRRQRVEDLVGDDETRDRGAVVVLEGRAEALSDLVEPARVDFDRPVAEALGQLRRLAPDTLDERLRKGAGSRAVLADREAARPVERRPDVDREPGQRPSEDRMGLGRSQEVAVAARPSGGAPVVAALGVVERQLHEPDEGHGPGAPNLIDDRVHQRRMTG